MKKIPVTEDLRKFFKSNPKTLNFEGLIKNTPSELFSDGTSYALVSNGETVCLFTQSTDFIDQVCAILKGEISFCGVDSFAYDYLGKKYGFQWESACGLFAWNGKPLTYKCKCDLRSIDPAYSQQISDGTPYHADLEEIEYAVAHRVSSAVYVDGKPVCWCLLHPENSLGMLYTLPQHRRKGYALEVMTSICNKMIAEGDIPYCYIIKGNTASENLAPKYNLTYVEDAYWVGVSLG